MQRLAAGIPRVFDPGANIFDPMRGRDAASADHSAAPERRPQKQSEDGERLASSPCLLPLERTIQRLHLSKGRR